MVPDVAGGLTEDKVQGKAFELVFAFDEVITTGGHKESITLQQVGTFLAKSRNWKYVVYLHVIASIHPFRFHQGVRRLCSAASQVHHVRERGGGGVTSI